MGEINRATEMCILYAPKFIGVPTCDTRLRARKENKLPPKCIHDGVNNNTVQENPVHSSLFNVGDINNKQLTVNDIK